MAAGALVGSAFMWLALGPAVLRRSAPKLVRGILMDTANLSDADVAAADGDLMKAMAKKQGKLMADSLSGAIGNIVQDMPTAELDNFAQQYGFGSAKEAAQKLGIGNGNVDPNTIMSTLQAIQGKGGGKQNNAFGRVAELMSAMQVMGVGQGGGNGSAPSWGAASSGSGGRHPFAGALGLG